MKIAAALVLAACAAFAGSAEAVTLFASVSGPGSITGPGGLNCPGTCTVTVPTGAITITAVHAPTAVVKSWPYPGPCPALQDTCTFTITGDQAFPVAFEALTSLKLIVRGRPQQTGMFFGYVPKGTVSQQKWEIEVRNTGTASVPFPGITVLGGPFQHMNDTCGPTIFAGDYCTSLLFMNSALAGYFEGTVSLGDSVVQRLNLKGYAINTTEKRIALYDNGTPSALDTGEMQMGSTPVGGYSTRYTSLVNVGTQAVTIQPSELFHPFSVQNNCPATLAAGGFSCAVQVFYYPTTPGTHTATLTITTDAGTKTIQISGTAEDPSQRGTVDPAFVGGNGRFGTFQFEQAGVSTFNRVAFGAGGSIYTAGSLSISGGPETTTAVYKLDDQGLEDPTFGGTFGFTGRQYIDLYAGRTTEEPLGLAVLSNGKVIVVSATPGPTGTTDAIVRRLMPNGAADTTFGTAGATVLVGNGGSALIVRADGRIVVAGRSGTNIVVTQLTAAGVLDPTFGTAGKSVVATDGAPDGTVAMRETPAQELIVAHSFTASTNVNLALSRLMPTGVLDIRFGGNNNGRVNLSAGSNLELVRDVAIKSDGRIAIAFDMPNATQPTKRDFAVAQFLANGTADPAFGTGSVATRNVFGYSGAVRALEALPNGQLLLAGYVMGSTKNYIPATVLFNAGGTIDPTWGNGGARLTYVNEVRDMPYDMARDAQGRLVLVGETSAFYGFGGAYYSRALLVRLLLPDPPITTPKPKFDFDGNRNADLLWRNTDGRQAIWLMDGITSTSMAEIIGAGTGWMVTNVADFDGNGKTDLVWEHTDGRIAIYLMNGTTPTSTVQILNAGGGWTVTHTPDLNGDGKADLIFRNVDGTIAAWLMNGTTMTSGATLFAAGSGWSVIRTGDFDGDGKTDLVWQHTDGRLAIWLMDGLTVKSTRVILNAGTGWTVTHTPDLDGNGKSDLVWQNTDGSVAVWLMDGTAPTAFTGLIGAATGWSVTRTGDFDGDGKGDLFFLHTDGRAAIFLMNGITPTQTTQILNAGGGWSAKRVQDLNGDGKSDIVWENVDGRTALWLMNGTAFVSGAGLLGTGTGWSVSGVSP
ncbi:hypothetical protein BWI17_14555 [Betaproteobacteria bacterium GR16-43]|nr:hypothetical protein BWI17_14555 [Betaproteobacteria bacterium GR16-43]